MVPRTALAAFFLSLTLAPSPAPAASPVEEGEAAYGSGEHPRAFRHFLKAAERGNAQAQAALAYLYFTGRGTPKDLAQAASWYRKAAEQGHPGAQFNLGLMHFHGAGAAQDLARAATWFQKAAEQGHPMARRRLAEMHLKGLGVRRDRVAAARWAMMARMAKGGPPRGSPAFEPVPAAEAAGTGLVPAAPERGPGPAASAPAPGSAGEAAPVRRYASDVDSPGYKLKERPQDFALVVGVENYKKLPQAKFAARDAEAVKRHLLGLGYPQRNIISLLGEEATRAQLQAYLEEWLPKNVKPESSVFVYYSGHGAPDAATRQAYLLPWDGDPKFLKTTAYPLKEFYAALNKLKAKEVLVALDACFSGAGGRSVLADGARPLVTEVAATADLGRLTLFSAAALDEITGSLEEQGHGLFTYFFLKGLSGAAKDSSGRVRAQGLYDYLRPMVEDEARRQNRHQSPVLSGDKDRLLVRF